MAENLYITQPSNAYFTANHKTWKRLYDRMLPRWVRWAPAEYLDGHARLRLPPHHIPRLDEVNARLEPLTGFRARAVAGYVPTFEFFACLRRREFPTTVTIRDADRLDYLPEPDIFHDVCGHVPMHACPAFADTLVRFGEFAHTAERLATDRQTEDSILLALSRFFWFSVEFGLMLTRDGMKACGSGLLSSYSEIEHAVCSPAVERRPFDLEEVIHQPFDIDHFQPRLYYIESFEHLYYLVGVLEDWLRAGRLDHIAHDDAIIRA